MEIGCCLEGSAPQNQSKPLQKYDKTVLKLTKLLKICIRKTNNPLKISTVLHLWLRELYGCTVLCGPTLNRPIKKLPLSHQFYPFQYHTSYIQCTLANRHCQILRFRYKILLYEERAEANKMFQKNVMTFI